MTRASLYCLPFLWLALSYPAQGGVIQRDWKDPGDGLLTFDDVNQREWLDLSETLQSQLPGETFQERYLYLVTEFNVGGTFEGFTIGKREDVNALAQVADIDTTTFDFDTNRESVSNLIGLLGVSFGRLDNYALSIGFIDDSIPGTAALLKFFPPINSPTIAGLSFSNSNDKLFLGGFMLYRQVPEPTMFTLLTICLSILCATRQSTYLDLIVSYSD